MVESGEIPTLDVSLSADVISADVLGQVMEGLVHLNKAGDPVTAHDFEYSWKRTLDPNTKSQYAFMVAWIKGGAAYNEGKSSAEDVGVKAISTSRSTTARSR